MYKVGKRSFKCNFKSFHNSSENFSSGLPLKLLLCNREPPEISLATQAS